MAVDSIDILGRPYLVEWVSELAGATGDCDGTTAHIRILENLDSYIERDTLLHEVMHGICRQQGREYTRKEEEYVGALATGLIAVLDANPNLRKYLFR